MTGHVGRVIRVAAPLLAIAVAVAGGQQPGLSPRGGYKGRFNNDDQHHADLCVTLAAPLAPLRYADGSPSGFVLTPDRLRPQPGSGVWCPAPGMARLDAREIVHAADGRPMLFHRGGWGFAGNDPESAVHYGHVLLADLDTVGLRYHRPNAGAAAPPYDARWTSSPLAPWIDDGQRAGNGSACASRSPTPVRVHVAAIPADMKYLNTKGDAAIPYAIYGDPSESLGPPADRARGVRYTMLEWSWINVSGGGVARAIVADGTAFYRCADVPAIRLASVSGPTPPVVTGWVEAVYGAIRAGTGDWLYGWIVAAHQRNGEDAVRHLME